MESRIANAGRLIWHFSSQDPPVAAEVLKNPLDRGWFLDARDHPQLPTTALADLDVYGEYPLAALRLRLRDRCRSVANGSPLSFE